MFRVGQKVVCIRDSNYEMWIRKGQQYIVRSINGPWIRLVGVAEMFSDGGFMSDRFRPLITQSDDIAMFKSLLTPALVRSPDLERMGSD